MFDRADYVSCVLLWTWILGNWILMLGARVPWVRIVLLVKQKVLQVFGESSGCWAQNSWDEFQRVK
jgi:hypothetical protein